MSFITLANLIGGLAKAEREGTLRERFQFYSRLSLLIVNEFGYVQVITRGGDLFFQLVTACYEKGAMIFTSHHNNAEKSDIFGSPVVATALASSCKTAPPAPPITHHHNISAYKEIKLMT